MIRARIRIGRGHGTSWFPFGGTACGPQPRTVRPIEGVVGPVGRSAARPAAFAELASGGTATATGSGRKSRGGPRAS